MENEKYTQMSCPILEYDMVARVYLRPVVSTYGRIDAL